MSERKVYIATVPNLGTRRVTSEFFTKENGFDPGDRQNIERLEIDKLLIVSGRQNTNSIRRVK